MLTVRTAHPSDGQHGQFPLDFYQMEKPEAANSQVVIEIAAAGVNRADLLQAAGKYPPPLGASDVLGLECLGTVSSGGHLSPLFSPNDSVVALLDSGGYAEFVAVDHSLVLPTPHGWEGPAGGGLMEAACTAWNNLVDVGGLSAGQTVLIHGGSGGVGTFAIQLAKALGATVIATARTRERADRCRALGADQAVAYLGFEDFPGALPGLIAELTNGLGADLILDVLGAKYLDAHVRSVSTGGSIVVIGMQRGARGSLDLSALLTKRASIHGTTLRSRPLAEKAKIVADVYSHVWPLLESGRIVPVLHGSFPLEEAREAHALLASGEVFGKLVLTPPHR